MGKVTSSWEQWWIHTWHGCGTEKEIRISVELSVKMLNLFQTNRASLFSSIDYLTAASAMIPIQYGTSSAMLIGNTKEGLKSVLFGIISGPYEEFVQSVDNARPPINTGGIRHERQMKVAANER